MTLIELMVVVGLVALISLVLITYSVSSKPASIANTREEITSAVAYAGALAAGPNGNGATIVIYPKSGTAQAYLQIYAGRPNGGFLASKPDKTEQLPADTLQVNGAALTAPFAIFVDGFQQAAYAPWSPGSGTITPWPVCSTGSYLDVTITNGATQSLKMACPGTTLDAVDAHGSPLPFVNP